MARYEHLPIHRAAFDLALHLETIVRNFSRYHKIPRPRAAQLQPSGARAHHRGQQQPRPHLRRLCGELERLKVLARLCHEAGGFASTRAYLHVSELVVGIAKQNEGWLRRGRQPRWQSNRRQRSGEGHGQNRAG